MKTISDAEYNALVHCADACEEIVHGAVSHKRDFLITGYAKKLAEKYFAELEQARGSEVVK